MSPERKAELEEKAKRVINSIYGSRAECCMGETYDEYVVELVAAFQAIEHETWQRIIKEMEESGNQKLTGWIAWCRQQVVCHPQESGGSAMTREELKQALSCIAEDGVSDGAYGRNILRHDQQQRDEIARLIADRDEFRRLNEHHKEQFLRANLELAQLRGLLNGGAGGKPQ